jgi:hypothetical protein
MMLQMPAMVRWTQAIILILGFWLALTPFTFGYDSVALRWSDLLSGVAAILIASATLRFKGRSWISYLNVGVGIWLLFAPLIFWAPQPIAYANDTLIGALLIALSLLIPMGMKMPGPDVPPGWSYNPSTWVQRAPIIGLGVLGFLVSRYMAAYQLGYIHSAWDPFFTKGTETILTSKVSKMWPISDAGLGSLTYLIEVLSGFMGDEKRWRTMPWMVAMFGIVVIPLGIVSIALVVMQPVVVGTWCSLCLLTAIAMLIMIPLSLDEVIAMIQFLNQSRKEGKSVWRTFWHGGAPSGASETPRPDRKPAWAVRAMLWGMTIPWNLALTAALGVLLMFIPGVTLSHGAFADSDHLVGALVVTVSVVTMAETARAGRYLNWISGLWLAIASWLLEGGSSQAQWLSSIAGVLVCVLSVRRGPVRESYGSFGRWVGWPSQGTSKPEHRAMERAA